jgi:ribosomal peptide maturation radical SAM protein 1
MGYRSMPAEQAIQVFEEMFARYGTRCKRFEAVDNILPREYLTEVLPFVKAPEGATIFYEVKADLKDYEMEILSRSGVNAIQPGIESLNTGTLKLMRKGVTAFQNIRFLKSCLRHGIDPAWNLLIGFPRETEEVYRKYVEDMPLLFHLRPPSGAYPVRFDRYSPYFTGAAEYGLNLSPYDYYRFIYPFPEESLANLAYFFEDRNYAAAYLSTMVAWQERLNKGTSDWIERFYGYDGLQPASLTFEPRGERSVIHDTRSGRPLEHELNEFETRILLDVDSTAWAVADVARHVGSDEASVVAGFERLRSLGLLFVEGERAISVVVLTASPSAGEEEDGTVVAVAKSRSLPIVAPAG